MNEYYSITTATACRNPRVVEKSGYSTRISRNIFLSQCTILWDIWERHVFTFGTVLPRDISLLRSKSLRINETRRLRRNWQRILDRNFEIAFILLLVAP